MKIFGRGKQSDDMAAEEIDGAEIEAAADDGDAGFDDTDAGLAAPKRFGGLGGGGSNKRVLVLLIVLVVLGGGGYGALTMLGGDDTPVPPPPMAAAQPMAAPGATPTAMAAPGMPGAVDPNAPAMPAVDPVTGQPLPAAMATPGMTPPGMTPPGAPPMPGAVAADAAVTPTTDAGMPPMPPVPPADANAVPATGAATAAATPPAGAPAAPAAAGAPVATDVTAAVTAPVDPNAPPMTAGAPTGAAADPIDAENGAEPAGMQAPGSNGMMPPPAGAMPAAAAPTAAATGTAAEAAPVSAQPGAEMPAPPAGPASQADAADAQRAAAAPANAQPATESNGLAAMSPQVPAAAPQKSPAEMTPEELAAMWATLPAEPAMVRPLPKKYLIVKKEASADTLDSRLASARRALNEGRPAAALEFFNTLLADYPSDGRVLMGRAVTLQRLGQNVEALRAYEQVLVNNPQNLDALTNMLGLLKQQNPQLAIDKLMALRTAYPYNADITTQLAIAYGDAGNLAESLRYMTLAEALQPDSGFVKYNKAVLYDRLGRESEAAELYRQLIRMSADGTLDQNLPMDAIKARLATMR